VQVGPLQFISLMLVYIPRKPVLMPAPDIRDERPVSRITRSTPNSAPFPLFLMQSFALVFSMQNFSGSGGDDCELYGFFRVDLGEDLTLQSPHNDTLSRQSAVHTSSLFTLICPCLPLGFCGSQTLSTHVFACIQRVLT
jgi:hypothetical protein